MDDLKTNAVLSFVRFDLINKEFEREFNIHFDEHIRELVLREGFCRAWRTREARRSWNIGLLEQEFNQIYQIDYPARFSHSNPGIGMPPASEKEPWRRDLGGWGRIFYRIASRIEKDERQGRYWARYEFGMLGDAAQPDRAALSAWMTSVCDLPGVHRGWLLDYLPDSNQVAGAPAANAMVLLEVDAPENIFDPSLAEDRVVWQGSPLVGRHFAHLLLSATDFS